MIQNYGLQIHNCHQYGSKENNRSGGQVGGIKIKCRENGHEGQKQKREIGDEVPVQEVLPVQSGQAGDESGIAPPGA